MSDKQQQLDEFEVIDNNNIRHRYRCSNGYSWQHPIMEGQDCYDVLDKRHVEILREDNDGSIIVRTFPNIIAVGYVEHNTCLTSPKEKRLTKCPRCGFTDTSESDLLDKVERLSILLRVSACPNTECIEGAIPVQIGNDEWAAEQCQFCYEKEEALKELEE